MLQSLPVQNGRPSARIDYADALRVTATVMVICIHVTAQLLGGLPNSKTWLFGNLLDSISRPAVPLFLMISGMLLLPPERIAPLSVFFKRRLMRVVLPFLGWSLIYFLWSAFSRQAAPAWSAFLPALAGGQIYYHLAFVYVIIGLYLITPLLQLLVCQARDRDFVYLLALWIASVALVPLITRFLGININYYLRPILGFTGYFVAGYYFSRVISPRLWTVLLVLFAGIAATFVGTLLLSQQAGRLDEFFYDYLSLPCIVAAFGWFFLFKQLPFSSLYAALPQIKKGVLAIGSVSFTIFLIHPIVMETLQFGKLGITLKANTISPLFGVPVSILVILLISAAMALLARRISFLRWLFQ